MAPRKKCSTCGSRQWRKNAAGLVTCSEGHVLQHYVNESGEADDVGTHMIRKRTLKSNRKEMEKASRADPKLYHGDRARFHYYQCLQLLFRKQVAALIALWNLPPRFETICRDLWAFHLNLIPRPPPAEPFHYTREQEGYQQNPEEVGQSGHSPPGPEGIGHPLQNTPVVSDESRSASEDEMFAPEIAVLLEENSEVSSTDGGSSGDEQRAKNNTHMSPSPFVRRADRPENTIALLVLACWTIRLPIIYMDFINVIEAYSLPYLDHVRSLPPSLARHLTKHAVQALSPHHAPKILSLHRLTSRLANRLYDTYDIVIPGLNTPPVLWRAMQECFCGTPMLYVLTKTVGNVLSLGLSLQGSSAALLCSTRGDVDKEKYDNAPPEVCLVATAIVVLKLVYGLDGKQRLPRNVDDAACAFPALNEFLAAVREADRAERGVSSRFGSRVSLSVGDLDDTALDEYLDFCQKVLIDPKGDGGWFFKFRDESGADAWAHGPDVMPGGESQDLSGRGLPPTKTSDGNTDILLPGEIYTIYDAKDVLGNLPADLKMFVDKSTRWTGINCDFVCGVVERYERRLVRWWNDRRSQRKGEEDIKGTQERVSGG